MVRIFCSAALASCAEAGGCRPVCGGGGFCWLALADASEFESGWADCLGGIERALRSQQLESPGWQPRDFIAGDSGVDARALRCPASVLPAGSGWMDGPEAERGPEGFGAESLFEKSLFEKKEPLSPAPGCSHRGMEYSAAARTAMTPSATRTLSAAVLTLPACLACPICSVCAPPADISWSVFSVGNARRINLRALSPAISNDSRRIGSRQRAAVADNQTWMQKKGEPASRAARFGDAKAPKFLSAGMMENSAEIRNAR